MTPQHCESDLSSECEAPKPKQYAETLKRDLEIVAIIFRGFSTLQKILIEATILVF